MDVETGNTYSLLVGVQTGTATKNFSVEFPQIDRNTSTV